MLVLTRRLDQSIMIGDPKTPEECIEVQVVEVRGDQVRVGVQAPRAVAVDRTEVWEAKQREHAAANPTPADVPALLAKR